MGDLTWYKISPVTYQIIKGELIQYDKWNKGELFQFHVFKYIKNKQSLILSLIWF